MTDQVRMISRTVFSNERATVFPTGGPAEGVKGGVITDGDTFTTDLDHAKDLDRLGLAFAEDPKDLEGASAPLQPHYSVAAPILAADQAARREEAERQADQARREEAERATAAATASAAASKAGKPGSKPAAS